MITSGKQTLLSSKKSWLVFFIYCLVTGYAMYHHELWGDEIHSWNIAKASGSFFDLIHNIRYEGHPPVWYIFLWTISKFTHDVSYIQVIHFLIACGVVFLFLFYSPFPFIAKVLVPFGYYFFYEYAVISRNYAIGVLLALLVCIIIRKNFKYKVPLYYALLFLMSNTHLLALLLAGSLHLYYLLLSIEQKKKTTLLVLHVILGVIVFLPAVYFIFPPSDSNLNINFWINRWNTNNIKSFAQAPLRAFLPVPAWWEYNSWNTQFLMEGQNRNSWLRFFNLFISMGLLVAVIFFFKRNRKCLALFTTNLLLSFIIAVLVFPLTRERYSGFLFIGFIVAWWLYSFEMPTGKNMKWFVYGLLVVQLAGGIISVVKDIRYPFSNAYRVNELLEKVPANEKTVTDYWALNTISAFADKPLYCVDMGKEISYVLWGPDLAAMLNTPNRYTTGIKNIFEKEGIKKVYMISTGSPETLYRLEPVLPVSFHITVTDKIEGAINKGSNLYLYEITPL